MKWIKIYIVMFVGLVIWNSSEAQFNLNSGTQWKVSGSYVPGWLSPLFDDVLWVNATSPHTNTILGLLSFPGTN